MLRRTVVIPNPNRPNGAGVAQLDDNISTLDNLSFTEDELAQIEQILA